MATSAIQIADAVAQRREAIDKALREGSMSSKVLTEGYAYIYKDGGVLGMGRSGSAELEESADDHILFTVSTLDEDRDGDIVVPMGCKLHNFAKNPVWFFGHQQWEIPIGTSRGPDGQIHCYPEQQRVRERFYPDQADEDAMFIFGKVQRGILNATSIAFVPIVARRREDVRKGHQHEGSPGGWIFDEWDKTETSIVGVPSNGAATVEQRSLQGQLRDSLDKEKSFIRPRLQKALLAYCAKSTNESGGCWTGWCPTCPPVQKETPVIAKESPDEFGELAWRRANKTDKPEVRTMSQANMLKLSRESDRFTIGDIEAGSINGTVVISRYSGGFMLTKKSLAKPPVQKMTRQQTINLRAGQKLSWNGQEVTLYSVLATPGENHLVYLEVKLPNGKIEQVNLDEVRMKSLAKPPVQKAASEQLYATEVSANRAGHKPSYRIEGERGMRYGLFFSDGTPLAGNPGNLSKEDVVAAIRIRYPQAKSLAKGCGCAAKCACKSKGTAKAQPLKPNIQISYIGEDDEGKNFTAKDTVTGKIAGRLRLFQKKDGNWTAATVFVDPNYRRQGIASSMYKFARNHGLKIVPGEPQSPDGAALWNDMSKSKVSKMKIAGHEYVPPFTAFQATEDEAPEPSMAGKWFIVDSNEMTLPRGQGGPFASRGEAEGKIRQLMKQKSRLRTKASWTDFAIGQKVRVVSGTFAGATGTVEDGSNGALAVQWDNPNKFADNPEDEGGWGWCSPNELQKKSFRKSIDSEYDQGYVAAWDGRPRNTNPYRTRAQDVDAASDWDAGWVDGAKERLQGRKSMKRCKGLNESFGAAGGYAVAEEQKAGGEYSLRNVGNERWAVMERGKAAAVFGPATKAECEAWAADNGVQLKSLRCTFCKGSGNGCGCAGDCPECDGRGTKRSKKKGSTMEFITVNGVRYKAVNKTIDEDEDKGLETTGDGIAETGEANLTDRGIIPEEADADEDAMVTKDDPDVEEMADDDLDQLEKDFDEMVEMGADEDVEKDMDDDLEEMSEVGSEEWAEEEAAEPEHQEMTLDDEEDKDADEFSEDPATEEILERYEAGKGFRTRKASRERIRKVLRTGGRIKKDASGRKWLVKPVAKNSSQWFVSAEDKLWDADSSRWVNSPAQATFYPSRQEAVEAARSSGKPNAEATLLDNNGFKSLRRGAVRKASTQQAYQEGIKAGKRGLDITDCPYEPDAMGAGLRDAWVMGFREGSHHSNKSFSTRKDFSPAIQSALSDDQTEQLKSCGNMLKGLAAMPDMPEHHKSALDMHGEALHKALEGDGDMEQTLSKALRHMKSLGEAPDMPPHHQEAVKAHAKSVKRALDSLGIDEESEALENEEVKSDEPTVTDVDGTEEVKEEDEAEEKAEVSEEETKSLFAQMKRDLAAVSKIKDRCGI